MIKKHKALLAYLLALTIFSTYVVMDTFVITRVYGEASDEGSEAALQIESNDDQAAQTEASASDDMESSHAHGHRGPHGDGNGGPGQGGKHGKPESSSGSSSSDSNSADSSSSTSSGSDISSSSTADSELTEYTVSGTVIHVAEVTADSAEYLKTAFAQGSYGKNVTATTSDIADGVNAILAINGDYYGAQEKGYVIRNGKLYRSTAVSGREDLVIYKDGSFEIINESEVTAEQLIAKGAVQTLSFGPALIESGKISVDSDDEVGRAQLAEFMKELGAETAYNLDGGGSSTMIFKGSVVNTPTGGGIGNGSGSERKVSDIVYIGY